MKPFSTSVLLKKVQGSPPAIGTTRKYEGNAAATAQLTTPFRLCTSGATVFAPGVNLTDFSAIYQSVFTPQETGEVISTFIVVELHNY